MFILVLVLIREGVIGVGTFFFLGRGVGLFACLSLETNHWLLDEVQDLQLVVFAVVLVLRVALHA
jgi:hypothetical protein